MAEKTTPPWAVEGAAVAVYTTGRSSADVLLTTIDRLTATQVVCANGFKFYRDTSHPFGHGLAQVGNYYGSQLLPAEDEQVRAVLAQREFHELRVNIDAVFRAGAGRFDTMLAALDRIAKLVAATHADIIQRAEGDQDEKES